jgi:hypothetical protein
VHGVLPFRLSVEMVAEIVGLTARLRTLTELTEAQRAIWTGPQREFINEAAAAWGGRIFARHDDAFWVEFPSVTAAALAASAMRDELLRREADRSDDCLAIRIAISVTDQPRFSLAREMAGVTPTGEIYLSAAARFAIQQREDFVRTERVRDFDLPGSGEPIPAYRVEWVDAPREIPNQNFVFIHDLRGRRKLRQTAGEEAWVATLKRLDQLAAKVCSEFGGEHALYLSEDARGLTFPDLARAMEAAEQLVAEWKKSAPPEQANCHLVASLYKGSFYLKEYPENRRYCLDWTALRALILFEESQSAIFATEHAREALAGTPWHARLRHVPQGQVHPAARESGIEVFRLMPAQASVGMPAQASVVSAIPGQIGEIIDLRIKAGPFSFLARFERAAAPRTCAHFAALLPYRGRLVHVHWGEACWVPMFHINLVRDAGLGWENATLTPEPGQILLHPGGAEPTEIRIPYERIRIDGNHFLTIVNGVENLKTVCEMVRRHTVDQILFELL